MQILVYVLIMVASYLLEAALAPKPKNAKPAALGDFDIQQVDEGTPQAIVFGDCWRKDWMILAYGNYRTAAIRKDDGAKK